ncbi:hypothetical protein [Nonomuraea sp. NPDC049504]|uniref:hypothetical protein n=1 Tax=Nonomuraea sp. NPDC049504 TaxID=3154729 RepID=UPI0034148563
MASSRVRVIIMAGVLGLVAVAGIVWLVGVATGDPGGSPTGAGVNLPVDDEDVPEQDVDDVPPPAGEPTSQERSQEKSRNNRRSVRWNGVRLDGSPGDDGCVTIINKTSTAGTIESVSFEVRSGPGRAGARSAPGRCEPTGDPLCQGVTLRPGSQCLAGAVITGEPSDSPYVIQAVVHFRYRCVNVEDSPCDEVQDWGGRPPTEQRPVEIRGATANNVPQFDYYIGGTDTSGDEDDPATSPEPSLEITETPDTSGEATPGETVATTPEGE